MGKHTILTVRQLGGIGDCLSLTPVFRGLREKYPKAKIQHITGGIYLGGSLVDIFSHVPSGFIDELHVIEPYDATPLRTREVWQKYYGNSPALENELLWQKADLTFDLNTPCVEYEWVAQHSPESIQKPRYQIWCEAASVVPSSYKPMYEVRVDERNWATSYYQEHNLAPDKTIGISVMACDPKRALPEAKTKDVCDKLYQAGWTPIIIHPTFRFSEYPAFNGLRLSQLMALIEQMRSVVSIDTGILHMAGAVGTPIVGIFGSTNPRMRMGMYRGSAIDSSLLTACSPCWYLYSCLQKDSRIHPFQCFSRISSDIVVEEVLRQVKQPKYTSLAHL